MPIILSLPVKVIAFSCLSLSGLLGIAHEVAGVSLDRRDEARMDAVIATSRVNSPVMVTSWLRLDSVRSGLRGKEVIYSMTMLQVNASEVTREQWLRQVAGVIAAAKGDVKLAPLAQAGIAVSYEYAGRDGLPIGTIRIRPEDIL